MTGQEPFQKLEFDPDNKGPLEGVRVLDLSRVVAVPGSTRHRAGPTEALTPFPRPTNIPRLRVSETDSRGAAPAPGTAR